MFKIDLLKKRKTIAVVDKHFSFDSVESNKPLTNAIFDEVEV